MLPIKASSAGLERTLSAKCCASRRIRLWIPSTHVNSGSSASPSPDGWRKYISRIHWPVTCVDTHRCVSTHIPQMHTHMHTHTTHTKFCNILGLFVKPDPLRLSQDLL